MILVPFWFQGPQLQVSSFLGVCRPSRSHPCSNHPQFQLPASMVKGLLSLCCAKRSTQTTEKPRTKAMLTAANCSSVMPKRGALGYNSETVHAFSIGGVSDGACSQLQHLVHAIELAPGGSLRPEHPGFIKGIGWSPFAHAFYKATEHMTNDDLKLQTHAFCLKLLAHKATQVAIPFAVFISFTVQ